MATEALAQFGAGIAIGFGAIGAGLGIGLATKGLMEGISRQPEASGKIQSLWMLGMVFIETVVIYALVVTILIVFVL